MMASAIKKAQKECIVAYMRNPEHARIVPKIRVLLRPITSAKYPEGIANNALENEYAA